MATKATETPKPEKKKGLTTEEKLEALIDLVIANGWTVPRGLKDD